MCACWWHETDSTSRTFANAHSCEEGLPAIPLLPPQSGSDDEGSGYGSDLDSEDEARLRWGIGVTTECNLLGWAASCTWGLGKQEGTGQ